MTASDLKKLRQYEDENYKLKQMVAEQTLDIRALKEVVTKNLLSLGLEGQLLNISSAALGSA